MRKTVKCMWMMLQNNEPEDFVIASGIQHSVRQFVELAFKFISIEIVWEGEGINEKGINKVTNQILVEVDSKYYRPTEVESLLGDPSKAKAKLKWNPNETSFEKLVEKMVKSDIKYIEHEKDLKQSHGDINHNSKIYIAGHNGMVGQACLQILKNKFNNIIGQTSKQLDLRNQQDLDNFINKENPDLVINAAGRVGGILYNINNNFSSIIDNSLIGLNLIRSSLNCKVKFF